MMKKKVIYVFFTISLLFSFIRIYGQINSEINDDILPESVLAFPFGNEDYKHKITYGLENAVIWSEKKIMAWCTAQGFSVTEDQPDGGYQYRRGIIFHPPGLGFNLTSSISQRGDDQRNGWKLVLDLGAFYSPPFEETLSTDFKHYENILRYEIWIDNIYYKTVEIGYGVSLKTPLTIEIPYIRDTSGVVRVELRMKNHPSNFGILYDAYLTL
ncbi:MAG: hypothetical protein OEV78_05855 [Spirochaetia bacterium]|nr:hypothetical protein [Spirochaetia bacterium]